MHYQRAIVAAYMSQALHEADRIRPAESLRHLRDAEAGLGAVGTLPGDVAEFAASATSLVADALDRRPSLAACSVSEAGYLTR